MDLYDFIMQAPRSQAHALTCLLNQTHEHAGNGPNIRNALNALRIDLDQLDAMRDIALVAWDERRKREHGVAV